MKITEAFDLPSREAITALGFVVKLQSKNSEEEKRSLVEDYVFTPAVRQALPNIFAGMRHALSRGEPLGRFIHGSFGSGKSHFLTMLAMLLEGDSIAWAKDDPLIAELAGQHRDGLKEANLLVVRVHMLSESSGHGFDRSLYDAFNRALSEQGKPPFEFIDVEGILDEARAEGRNYGDAFWRRAADEGAFSSEEEFEESAGSNDFVAREELARAYLEFKGRDPGAAGLNPNWSEGLRNLTRHAKAQGYGGVAFLIDEFLLWLSEKSGTEFKQAINQLTAVVDHSGGKRELPIFAFIARQRNIQEFFPDLDRDRELHEHLAHHTKRFEETKLEDVELRHICKQRVLKKREPAAIAAAVDQLEQSHQKVLASVLQGADHQYIRDVYPFHPALIEMLVDVSSRLQRERTALRIIYELLVVHYPDLELGKFIPVGRAFEALLPESGVDGGRDAEELVAIHKLFYERLRPAMNEMLRLSKENQGAFDERRRQALEEVVKTVLLGESSPRLKGSGLTVQKLVHLNDAEVAGTIDRGRFASVSQDLIELSRVVSSLQVSGTGPQALVSVVLRGADLGEALARAKESVNEYQRREVFLSSFTSKTQLAKANGFSHAGDKLEGDLRFTWRGTQRKGSVRLCNVREQGNAAFKLGSTDAFRILIDLPWDEPGHSVEDDVRRAKDVQQRYGRSWTLCWLPSHFVLAERELLRDLAALRILLTQEGQDRLLKGMSQEDRQSVVSQAESMQDTLQQSLNGAIENAYLKSGRVVALTSDVRIELKASSLGGQLEGLALELLDRRFPTHPDFKREAKLDDLQRLVDWLVRAHEAGTTPVPFTDAEHPLLDLYGKGLEAVSIGQGRATLNSGSRFLKLVTREAQEASIAWNRVDGELEKEPYGFQAQYRSLLMTYLARSHGFRIIDATGATLEPKVTSQVKENLRLVRAPLLDIAAWGSVVDLAEQLFNLDRPVHRTLTEQDRLARDLQTVGSARRTRLTEVRSDLIALGVPTDAPRIRELDAAVQALVPLVKKELDSHVLLADLSELWNGEALDGARRALRQTDAMAEAVNRLNARDLKRLQLLGQQQPADAASIRSHLESLSALLAASSISTRALSAATISEWNNEASAILDRELAARPPQPPTPPLTPPPGPEAPLPDGPGVVVLEGVRVQLGTPEALENAFGALRRQLEAQPPGEVQLEIRVVRSH